MRLTKVKLLLAAAASTLLLPLVAGCRVGYPFRGPGYDSTRGVIHPGASTQVFIAITQGDVEAGKGRHFSTQLDSVLGTMKAHDGLIGYAVRKQLFGPRVWTMSAWIDRESMELFAASPEHRRAIAEGGIAPASFSSAFTYVDVGQVPLSWSQAEQLLEAEPKRE